MTMSVHSELASVLNKLEFYPKSVAELYKEASQMLSSGKFSEAADKVEAALKELEDYQEEDKQTWGFAELQLLYGKSLLEIIKCSSNNEEIFGPKVPKVVGLCTNSDEVEEEEESAETDDSTSKQLKGETSGEDTEESKNEEDSLNIEDKEQIQTEVEASSEAALPEQQLIDEANSEGGKQSEEEEQDIRELAWEQLECARVILTSKLPESRLRLAVVYETLGDFGMENDNNEQAADDFKSAVKYYEEEGYHSSRMVGGLYHSIYLALRSVDPNNARKYLKLAADVFKRRIAESKEKLGDQARRDSKGDRTRNS
ncbi:uncharacterized protein Gasu_56690 [Galdieria sulphuraria]|uniref:Tetratricopeptide SHNi-TPR domain-containing protein n=1 Tax=Galdieria sulphuraria TaxID=130081 RepID=M2XTN6_GALSU|nr:uncharacterized protein Gasu_56690 [Galdieria sulphuraria]EME26774.1 hypothetical protein Gasu_56690 [Galdieria sulphuraria]|eukprot:XP_005703294.1 hypothetical protein Gasu_56690 [Galdieria sulphuraria]